MRKYSLLIVSILFVAVAVLTARDKSTGQITLKSYCPPGFELTDSGKCISRNLYQQYGSLRDAGVGGLRSALPEPRDGFTPEQIDLGRYLFFDPALSGNGKVSL